MVRLEEWMDVKELHHQGHSIRTISQMTGRSRNTIRRILRQKARQGFKKPDRKSKLDAFKPYLEMRYKECRLSCIRLHDEIGPMGYTGSIDLVRRFIQELKPRSAERLTVRFETPAGQQAQADWGYCGRFQDAQGRPVCVYAFVMILSFSRYMYVRFTSSMKTETLIDGHKRAFNFFGGWPKTLLFDNMKQVKLDRETWNPQFMDFANHYGLVIKTHQPYRARTKGKVERMVCYVKDNFLNGRVFVGLEDLEHWLVHTANARVHSTTGKRPADLLANEGLTCLSTVTPYRMYEVVERKVDWEGMVRFAKSRYSVRPEQGGKMVLVEKREQKIILRCGSVIIAEHKASEKPGACVTQNEHLEQLWKLSVRRATGPLPSWQLTFQDTVAMMPLARYEEVV